jgi:hypothetical protein
VGYRFVHQLNGHHFRSVFGEVKINQGDIEQMVNTTMGEIGARGTIPKTGPIGDCGQYDICSRKFVDLILVGQVPAISLPREREGLFPRKVGQFPGALDRSDFGARPLGMIALDAQ